MNLGPGKPFQLEPDDAAAADTHDRSDGGQQDRVAPDADATG
jgi:hypothetical protein